MSTTLVGQVERNHEHTAFALGTAGGDSGHLLGVLPSSLMYHQAGPERRAILFGMWPRICQKM